MLNYSDKIKNKETFLINQKLVDILNKTKNSKKKLKISIITAFTNQLIENYINFLFEEKIEIQFLSYGNSLSYIEDGDEIFNFKPDYIFVFLELENLVPNIYSINLNFNGNLFKEINNLKTKLAFSLKRFQKKKQCSNFFFKLCKYI